MLHSEFNYEKYLSENCKSIKTSFIREILNVAGNDDMISFAGGLPNPDCFPVDALAQSLQYIMKENADTILQYADSQGYYPLRQWIATRYYINHNIVVNPENILITNGSQQALDLLGKMFINRNESIILEKPSYLGAIQAFSAYGPQMIQVALQRDGIDIDELEEKIIRCRPRFVYIISSFQNPSGISYSLEKRKALSGLINKYRILLIEDDPYGEIYFNKSKFCPVYRFASNYCILTGSFSKMISPGIRTGWIIIPEQLKVYLLKAKQAADLHTNNLVQYAIWKFIASQDFEEHLNKIRIKYELQKNCMIHEIKKQVGSKMKLTNPMGGMFLWGSLPQHYDTCKLIEFAKKEKVVFVPGNSFFIEREGLNTLRINFSNCSEQIIKEGVLRVKRAIDNYEVDYNFN